MVEVLVVDKGQYLAEIRELFEEYLVWANGRVLQEFGAIFDTPTLIEETMRHLDNFMPPAGRLVLARTAGQMAGIAALKRLEADIGEIKRMYVRPASRGQGIGKAMLDRLVQEARQIRYQRLRLDSARFMTDAHRLYRSAGFNEVPEYAGSEIPPEFRGHWVFMELSLAST